MASVDASSSAPKLSSLTGIFTQFLTYTLLSICFSFSFLLFCFSLSLFVFSSGHSESSRFSQHIIAHSTPLSSFVWKLFLGQFFCVLLEALSHIVSSKSFCSFSSLCSLRTLTVIWHLSQGSIHSFSLFSLLICIFVFPFQIFWSSIRIAPKVFSYQEMSVLIICMIC